MLDDLRFVAAAVAKKDYVADLTHFKIKDGRVIGHNGRMSLCSTIPIALDIRPNAATFLAAVRACPGAIALTMTAGGKLTVRSEKFKTHVECLPEDGAVEFLEPEGKEIELGETFLQGLRLLSPLMGIDASRPWAMGIRLSKSSMFATNNVMIGEFWHGKEMPLDCIIPAQAVDQLLRINENPTKIQITENSASFWFGENRWMRTTLIDPSQWPDEKITQVFSLCDKGRQWPISEDFKKAVETLKPFMKMQDRETIFISADKVSSAKEEDSGASIEVDNGLDIPLQAYSHRQLEILCQVATSVDWTSYPKPAMFMAPLLRGVLVGQNL